VPLSCRDALIWLTAETRTPTAKWKCIEIQSFHNYCTFPNDQTGENVATTQISTTAEMLQVAWHCHANVRQRRGKNVASSASTNIFHAVLHLPFYMQACSRRTLLSNCQDDEYCCNVLRLKISFAYSINRRDLSRILQMWRKPLVTWHSAVFHTAATQKHGTLDQATTANFLRMSTIIERTNRISTLTQTAWALNLRSRLKQVRRLSTFLEIESEADYWKVRRSCRTR
jgi:hypothetical protein